MPQRKNISQRLIKGKFTDQKLSNTSSANFKMPNQN